MQAGKVQLSKKKKKREVDVALGDVSYLARLRGNRADAWPNRAAAARDGAAL